MEVLKEHATELLILLFLIVTFLQSGLDKLFDWKGNVSFTKEHFKNSPLRNSVPFLLATILVMELAASVLMIVGFFSIVIGSSTLPALYGIILSALSLIFLLIGQRLAKDYAGAMTLAVYFIIAIFGVFLLSS